MRTLQKLQPCISSQTQGGIWWVHGESAAHGQLKRCFVFVINPKPRVLTCSKISNSCVDLYSSCLSDKDREALKSSNQLLVLLALVRQNPNLLGGKHRGTEIWLNLEGWIEKQGVVVADFWKACWCAFWAPMHQVCFSGCTPQVMNGVTAVCWVLFKNWIVTFIYSLVLSAIYKNPLCILILTYHTAFTWRVAIDISLILQSHLLLYFPHFHSVQHQTCTHPNTEKTASSWPIENLMSCRGQSPVSHPQTLFTSRGNWTDSSHLIWPQHCSYHLQGKHNRPPWHWPSITRTLYFPSDAH